MSESANQAGDIVELTSSRPSSIPLEVLQQTLDSSSDVQASDIDALALVIKRLQQLKGSRKDVEAATRASALLRHELLEQPDRAARLVVILQVSIDSLDPKLYHRGLELLQVTSALAGDRKQHAIAVAMAQRVLNADLEETLRRGQQIKRKSDLMIIGEVVKVAPALLSDEIQQLLLDNMIRSLKQVESTALRTKIILGLLSCSSPGTNDNQIARLQPFLQDASDPLTIQALSRSILPKILNLDAAKSTLRMLQHPRHLVSWLAVASVCTYKSILRMNGLDQRQLRLAMMHLDDGIRLASFETMVTCAAISQPLEGYDIILEWFGSNMRVYNGS